MTKDERIQQLESDIKELDGKYQALLNRMQAQEEQKDMDLKDRMEFVRMREHMTFYKRMYELGDTMKKSFPVQDSASDSQEVKELKKRIKEDQITIDYLKAIISEKLYLSSDDELNKNILYRIFTEASREYDTNSQPKIDDESKKRIRSLRADGISIRQIAKMESVSVGVVHKIIHAEEESA